MTKMQFESASVRHKGQPLVFDWTYWRQDAAGPETVEFMVDPMLDMIRMGAAFGAFALNLQKFGQPDSDIEALSDTLTKQMPKVKLALRDCLLGPYQQLFDDVADTMDLQGLSKIVRWIMNELSGLDPTQPASSPDGSLATGDALTGGVLPAALTPEPSPLPGPSTST